MSPKYALVTGASSGIGYNLAIELSKKVIKSLDVPTTGFIWSKPLEQEYGVISLPLDVTDIDNIKTVLKKSKK